MTQINSEQEERPVPTTPTTMSSGHSIDVRILAAGLDTDAEDAGAAASAAVSSPSASSWSEDESDDDDDEDESADDDDDEESEDEEAVTAADEKQAMLKIRQQAFDVLHKSNTQNTAKKEEEKEEERKESLGTSALTLPPVKKKPPKQQQQQQPPSQSTGEESAGARRMTYPSSYQQNEQQYQQPPQGVTSPSLPSPPLQALGSSRTDAKTTNAWQYAQQQEYLAQTGGTARTAPGDDVSFAALLLNCVSTVCSASSEILLSTADSVMTTGYNSLRNNYNPTPNTTFRTLPRGTFHSIDTSNHGYGKTNTTPNTGTNTNIGYQKPYHD